ncbi:MAG: Holliday junction branch migration protein RuvA [Alphaproteobacteria bacterium]
MMTFLQGTIDAIYPTTLAINVHGVGYEAACSSRTLAKLAVGQAVKLLVHHHVREDAHLLFGFADEAERALFRLLTSVNGVGPKAGLSILSTLSPAEVADAVATQNGKMIARANGVGPKLGERVVLELKGKLGVLPMFTDGTVMAMPTGVAADVLSALMNMGYKEDAAQKAVSATVKSMPDADFAGTLKQALQGLR